jgi:hypothetical protein
MTTPAPDPERRTRELDAPPTLTDDDTEGHVQRAVDPDDPEGYLWVR